MSISVRVAGGVVWYLQTKFRIYMKNTYISFYVKVLNLARGFLGSSDDIAHRTCFHCSAFHAAARDTIVLNFSSTAVPGIDLEDSNIDSLTSTRST